ncbi:MAG: hypothetical protein HY234_06905 [Acidobacteria bacterium]|nr:hypothetical protein [Acidobacteriota bacterium]MBI3662762.1 hypothetical protein [Acidobacteriota bacterium]
MRQFLKAGMGLAACFAVAAGVAGAQQAARTPMATLPTADQVLAKYVQAVGGKAAIEKLSSRVTKGTVDPGGGPVLGLEINEKAPDKFLSQVDVPGLGAVRQGFDGTVAWESNPQQGVQELGGTMLAAARRNAQFYRWLRMRELFAKLDVPGTTKVGDREAYVLEATPQAGYAERFYFDTETGLLLRREYKVDGPDNVIAFEMYYDDYREVDGIKLPFALRRVGPDNVLLLRYSEIKHNVALDDARFAKPAIP